MARVKRGVLRATKRGKLLKQAKGYKLGRKNLVRQAHQAVKKSGQRAYDHRKLKKRQRRGVWNIKINAGARELGISYSRLIDALHKKNIAVDRKILAQLAHHYPEVFKKLVESVK